MKIYRTVEVLTMNRDMCKNCDIYRREQLCKDRGELSCCKTLITDFELLDKTVVKDCRSFVPRKDGK